jgi:hypothetical protein
MALGWVFVAALSTLVLHDIVRGMSFMYTCKPRYCRCRIE